MTINKITDTPILMNGYNSRGLITNNAVIKTCVRQADGTLWAVIGLWAGRLRIMRSTDNGFSWDTFIDGAESGADLREEAGFVCDGFFVNLLIDERWNRLDVICGEWETIGNDGAIFRQRYDLDDSTTAVDQQEYISTTENNLEGTFCSCNNGEQQFHAYVAADDTKLNVFRGSPRDDSVSSDVTLNAPDAHIAGLQSVCCTKNGKVYLASVWLDTTHKIGVVTYDSTTPSIGSMVVVENLGHTNLATDLSIAVDGLGNLCLVFFDVGDEQVRYATSIDAGATWDVNTLTRTSGHAVFADKITSDVCGRTNVIAGSQGGFLMAYVEDNSAGTPRTYVREITTSDSGATYDLQAEKEIATANPWTTSSITGLQFFHPTDIKLLDISDPGKVRIAFSVEEGDSTDMSDTIPISIGQELLGSSAYPNTLTSEGTSHTIDTADTLSLRVLVDIHAGPNSNLDFYSASFTGNHTDRFMAAFDRMGTSMRLLSYQPLSDNLMSDRSAYDSPTESNSTAIFSPRSYTFPTPAIIETGIEDWIEKDVRKIYLPPDLHLARTFLVNQGGYLKRTVWLCEFNGNQYELSQVVPRFLSNQICYYEANAYVVGPSNDPFSRTILPSET